MHRSAVGCSSVHRAPLYFARAIAIGALFEVVVVVAAVVVYVPAEAVGRKEWKPNLHQTRNPSYSKMVA